MSRATAYTEIVLPTAAAPTPKPCGSGGQTGSGGRQQEAEAGQ